VVRTGVISGTHLYFETVLAGKSICIDVVTIKALNGSARPCGQT
jgi:hypothetical protein